MNLLKNYMNILYWIAMAGLIFWFAYSKGWIFANFQSIDAKQAMHLLENDDNVTLLDVRTIQEYKSGHLRNAVLIPVQALSKNLGMLKQDKDKKIIVYCRTGSRSVSASRILEENGFTPLNVKGGIIQLMGAKAELVQ
ncbi:rhodanese-like domain-containing protein [Sulfurovum sp.]|uniref:rhodanese-like domain-containing protein n=1 Tax=Sulfurovum sp. TaxID=1969726 RepID=UPI00356395E3